jgi:type IV pilus assembly protein PilE
MIKQTGVTLLELMIVLAVLSVIAAIAVPAYTGYIKSSKESECDQEVAVLEQALAEHHFEFNTYFLGSGIAALEAASNNFYVSSYTVKGNAAASAANIANANCTYDVVAGATGDIATSYKITATGQNDLAGEGCIAQKPTDCP